MTAGQFQDGARRMAVAAKRERTRPGALRVLDKLELYHPPSSH